MMWPDDFYYQRYMFYCSKWTKDMERTFVSKLLNHAKKDRFHPDHENKFTITDALEAVHKCHGVKIDLGWGKYVVKFLRERHDVCGKPIACRDVICNTRLRFVIAFDSTWKEFCEESRVGKCYMNAYKDMWDDLYKLFAQPVDSDSASIDDASPEMKEGDAKEQSDHTVALPPSGLLGVAPKNLCPYGYVLDNPTLSSSLWNFFDDLYGCKDDADSLQPLSGAPSAGQKCSNIKCGNPGAARSEGQASSSPSNRTPVKKVD